MHEYDPNHFQYVRQTKLPRAAFDAESTGHYWVGVICTVIAGALFIFAALGVFA